MKPSHYLKAFDFLDEKQKQAREAMFESPMSDQSDTAVDVVAEIEAFVNRPEPYQEPVKTSRGALGPSLPSEPTPFAKAAGFAYSRFYRT